MEELPKKILEKRGFVSGATPTAPAASNGQAEPVKEPPAPTTKEKRQTTTTAE